MTESWYTAADRTICKHCAHGPLQVRQSAGLLLKNNLKGQYTALSEDFRNYIKVGPTRVLNL